MRYILTLGLVVLTLLSGFCNSDKETVSALARRVVPEISDVFVFENIEAKGDTFAVSTRGDKVLIEGSSPVAMSVGLNNYLRQCMGTNVSWFTDEPVYIPSKVVYPKEPITGNATVN